MIVVGITGASGVIYGKRICDEIVKNGGKVGLVVSEDGKDIIKRELNKEYSLENLFHKDIIPGITEFSVNNMAASIASGSFKTEGMVIAPCSINTLGAMAAGLCNNLLLRAGQVNLKERRPFIILPRESPLGLIQLKNLTLLCEAGATIVPPIPAFYHNPRSIDDLVDFTVSRVLNLLGIEHNLIRGWGCEAEDE